MAKVITSPKFKVYQSTGEIRKQLRQIQWDRASRPTSTLTDLMQSSPNKDLPIVVTRRASGKTTGLVYFLGERTLIQPEASFGVIVPTEEIGVRFAHVFESTFPTLTEPHIIIASRLKYHQGQRFTEVYIEEVFGLKEQDLFDACHQFPVVAGVGTIEMPTTITIRV